MIYLDARYLNAIRYVGFDLEYCFPDLWCELSYNSSGGVFHYAVIFRTFADMNHVKFPRIPFFIFIQGMPFQTFFFCVNQILVLDFF